jgi:hypothetical protein
MELQLCNKDTFQIRKKLFRFEYGIPETITANDIPASPVVTKVPRTPRVPRRSSMRMSLVPSNKKFVSHTEYKRRQSVLAQEEAGPEEQEEEVVVDIIEGEGGDLLYVEAKTEMGDEDFVGHGDNITPKEVPDLVVQFSDPTSNVAGPQSTSAEAQAPSTPLRVSAQVALSTPRGPVTLHKALLLRSARKAWEATRTGGVDDAIEDGAVEIKRKSLSPKRKSISPKRKSMSPKSSPASKAVMTPTLDEEAEERELQEELLRFEAAQAEGMGEVSGIGAELVGDIMEGGESAPEPVS